MTPDRIGFDRTLRLPWLDQAALLASELRNEDALRIALLEWLSSYVAGEESRWRTAQVLTRMWWRVPEAHVALRDEALGWIAGLPAEERLVLHWGMALLAYPFFLDVATIIGRLLRLQGAFKLAQVSERIGARWGNRSTLEFALAREMHSLVNWGVLQHGQERGIYVAAPSTRLPPTDAGLWLLGAVLCARGETRPASDLLRAPELFPFDIAMTLSDMLGSQRFLLHQEGLDTTLVQLAQQ